MASHDTLESNLPITLPLAARSSLRNIVGEIRRSCLIIHCLLRPVNFESWEAMSSFSLSVRALPLWRAVK